MDTIDPLLQQLAQAQAVQPPAAGRRQNHMRILRHIALLVSVLLTATHSLLQDSVPEAYHTSALSGEEWVMELITGHPDRMRCELGMHADVFHALIAELRVLGYASSRHVSLEEQLAIFLYTCVTGLTIRHVGERFQRSNDTISKYFRKILFIFASPPFYTTYVCSPNDTDDISSNIRNNPKFWPYFKDAIGAIDGSHIHARPSSSDRPSYRNRKGFISQNCLFACTFNLKFSYALTGWEGSATDARLYDEARSGSLYIPPGKYFLADAGFPLCDELLVPYRSVRYHLAEWGRANLRPTTKEELFNLRHSSARNVIERIFGVLKRRFRILLLSPEYPMTIQARIPAALCAIHNFISTHNPDDNVLPDDDNEHFDYDNPEHQGIPDDEEEFDGAGGMKEVRNRIARCMWEDYQTVLQQRGLLDDSFEDSDNDM